VPQPVQQPPGAVETTPSFSGEEPPAASPEPDAPYPEPEHIAVKSPPPALSPAPAADPPEPKDEAPAGETPNPPAFPDDREGQDVPPRDPEFQEGIVVTARYVAPTGPRVRGELSLPRLPADALRSLAAGKQLVVRVRVDQEGKATVTGIDGLWLPEAVQQRVCESLESRPWIPGTDTSGAPRESEAVVIFLWSK
jgi:hypothetical protein